MTQKTESSKTNVLRRRAEKAATQDDTSAYETLSPEQTRQMLHELRVHQIELQLQNEELRETQEKLEHQRERYFELYEQAPVGYLTLNTQGRILEANLTAVSMLGSTRTALLKKKLTAFIHPEDQDIYYLNRKKTGAANEPQPIEVRMIRADNSQFWALLKHTLAVSDEYRITLTNISKRKYAEESLIHKEKLLSSILHTTIEGFWIVDLQGRFIDVNDAYCRMTGYSRDELLGMTILDLEAVEDQDDIDRNFEKIIKDGSRQFETRHRCKDGRIIELEISATYLPDEGKVFTFLHDLTERNRMEHEIRAKEELVRAASIYTRTLIEASLDPLVTISADGMITDVNEASVQVTGIPREQLIGTDFSTCFTEPEKAREGYLRVFADGAVHDYPLALRHVSGRITEVLYNASIYKDEKGEIKGVFAAARDVTTLNRAIESLKQVHAELESKVAERTAALEHSSEQIKKVSLELVWAEEKERERIAGELHDRVGQSLLLAKMKLDALAEKLTSDSDAITLAEAASLLGNSIQDIRSLTFRMRPPILDTSTIDTALKWLCTSIGNDYHMQVEFDNGCNLIPIPKEMRYAVYHVVRELLINVAKHAGTHQAHLILRTDDASFMVKVSDQGKGFSHPDAHLKHITNGGYGLYNVQQRIEQMGGTVVIESETGRGTSVTLTLPLHENSNQLILWGET